MKSIAKLAGLSTCCLAGGVVVADAEPIVLADAELDRVAAGACMAGPGAQYCNDTPGAFILLLFPPPPPIAPGPSDPPGSGPFLGFTPFTPIEFPQPGFGPKGIADCSPAFDCGVPILQKAPPGWSGG